MGLGDHLKEEEAGTVVLSGLCCRCRKQGCEEAVGHWPQGVREGDWRTQGVGQGPVGLGALEEPRLWHQVTLGHGKVWSWEGRALT